MPLHFRRVFATVLLVLLSASSMELASASTPSATPPATSAQIIAQVTASSKIKSLTPGMLSQLSSIASYAADRYYKLPAGCLSPTACVFGDMSSKHTMVLLGDSHSRMWLPALVAVANNIGFRLVVIGHDSCPVASVVIPGGAFNNCAGYRSTAFTVINTLKPQVVLMGNRTSYPSYKGTQAQWQAGVRATLAALAPSGATLGIIGDIQVFNLNVPSCLSLHPNGLALCGMKNPNTAIPGHEVGEAAAARVANVTYVDPTPYLCTSSSCSPVIGDYVVYVDSQHLAVPYVAYLTGVMTTALSPLLVHLN